MKKTHKIILGVLIGLILVVSAALLLVPSENGTLTKGNLVVKETVKIGYKDTLHYLPVMVAKERGFFEEEGINAELVNFQSSNQAMDAILTGDIDVALGNMVLQFNVEQKQPGSIKAFMISNETAEKGEHIDFLLVKKDSEIDSIRDLKGKRIGTNPGTTSIAYVKLYIKANGIDEDDVEILTAEQQLHVQALETEQFDAVHIYEPDATIALDKGIARVLEEAPIERFVMNPWTSSSGYMSSKFLEERPDAAKKTIRAMIKAVNFIREDPGKAREVLPKYTSIDETLAEKVNIVPYFGSWEIDKADVQRQADIMFEEGVIKGKVNTTQLFLT